MKNIVNDKMYALGTKRSAIRELFEYGKKIAAEQGSDKVYDFSIGNPSVPAPDCVNEAIIDLLQNADSTKIHGYTSAQGDVETRTAIAEYLNKTYQTSFEADDLYMTCGAAASLTLVFKAMTISAEDEFIIIAPFFPEYQIFIQSAGAKAVIVPPDTADFQINLSALEAAITPHTRGIVINSPNNPSGVVYSVETIKKLAAMLKKKSEEFGTEIFIIADEPYREIAYDGVEVPYVTKYYENTIVCYSYSKSLSLPGERIGYILVPKEAADSSAVYAAICGAGRALGYVCAPSLFQKMLVRCIGAMGDINLYKKNRDILYVTLSEMGYECFKPEGAFYLFVKALEPDAEHFCEAAREENLLLVAADDFGCPGYVRISYCVDYEMIKRSFAAFERLKEKYDKLH